MKRIVLFFSFFLVTFSGIAQKQPKFTEEDVAQFYRTLQGEYTVVVNDSTTALVHIVPIWEHAGESYQWLYLEATMEQNVILQKVLEVKPKNEKLFRVFVHDLKEPAQFAGKWGNPNYFDGFNTAMLKTGKRISFVKTHDFSYQSQWSRFKEIDCFPKGDLLHFKFVEQDERFYVKRMPKGTNRILGYQGLKELKD